MINPPFPYNVVISRKAVPEDPFTPVEQDATIIYDGVCDFEVNRHPSYKNNVQVGKYKLYIPDNTIALEMNDTIELQILSRKMVGNVLDFFPTNFGITVYWDSAEN